MSKLNIDHLKLWVEDYYRPLLKNASINNSVVPYYFKLKGYYKTKEIVDDIIASDFFGVDTLIWFTFLKSIKKSSDPLNSGGGFLRYKDYKDKCSQSSFYMSRSKFIKLELIIETPFVGYYILNPEYIIKLTPKNSKEDV